MPLKLIGTIILLVVVTVFCGFNLENKCNISFVFANFENVSVFVLVMFSFVAGVLVTLPFAIFKKKPSGKKTSVNSPSASDSDSQKKDSSSAGEESGEKTVFDFKIRRQTSEKSEKKDEKKQNDKK